MNYRTINRLFTFACFSLPPILGSVVSFVWHGGAIWCVFAILFGNQKFSPDKAMRTITFFMYLYAAANVVSFLVNDPSLSLAYRLLPLVTFLFFPFSYSLWSISDKDAIARAAIFASMATSFAALAFALFQHYALDLRAEGGAGNALVFATVTCMAGLVSLAGAFTLERRWTIALLAGFLASVLTVLLSESRSIWIVMIVLTAVVLFVYRSGIRQVLKGRVLPVLAVLALIGILASGVIAQRMGLLMHNWEQFADQGVYRSSLGFRLALWQIGWQMFLESPLIGNGLQNTSMLIRDGLLSGFGLTAQFSHFHNGFLTLLVESGIIGAGAIIGIFATALWNAFRVLFTVEDATRRFGAVVLLILTLGYGLGGSVNLLIGHDILDTVFMIFLIIGTYLATGTSMISGNASRTE